MEEKTRYAIQEAVIRALEEGADEEEILEEVEYTVENYEPAT